MSTAADPAPTFADLTRQSLAASALGSKICKLNLHLKVKPGKVGLDGTEMEGVASRAAVLRLHQHEPFE